MQTQSTLGSPNNDLQPTHCWAWQSFNLAPHLTLLSGSPPSVFLSIPSLSCLFLSFESKRHSRLCFWAQSVLLLSGLAFGYGALRFLTGLGGAVLSHLTAQHPCQEGAITICVPSMRKLRLTKGTPSLPSQPTFSPWVPSSWEGSLRSPGTRCGEISSCTPTCRPRGSWLERKTVLAEPGVALKLEIIIPLL